MSELREIVRRLALVLGRLDDTTHLGISREGSDRFIGEDGSNRYLQFGRSGSMLRAESVGDRYLSGPDRLTDEQHDALRELGWQDPNSSGNHWRHWDAPLPLEEIAAFAVETLERVHGVIDLEQLRFDAAPTVLAPLHDAFRPDPRVLRIGYWDYDGGQPLTCRSCAWSGVASDHEELHRDVVDVRCPSCEQLLVVAVLPTLEETRRAAADGNARAIVGLADIEAQAAAGDAARATLLRDPSQLPEIEGDSVVIEWDIEGADPNLVQVLRHRGVVVWRETAFYESYRRFEEVFAVLRDRCAGRFAGLVPSKRSELWLYGDRLSSPAVVRSLNESVAPPGPSGLVTLLAATLDSEPEAVAATLPSPAALVEIDDLQGGVRWLACGDPVLVLVGQREGTVVVGEPAVEWLGHTPELRVRVEHALSASPPRPTVENLAATVADVVAARQRTFQECGDCGEPNPPEWITDGPLCHGCAQSNHGVVF